MRTQVTLLTHSDPGELLPGDTLRLWFFHFVRHQSLLISECQFSTSLDLRNMLYPKMAREAGHYFETWVARWQNFQRSSSFMDYSYIRIIHVLLQVSSSVEGPGGVTAEAIFDRVEQIDCEVFFGELIPLKIFEWGVESLYLWRSAGCPSWEFLIWRAYCFLLHLQLHSTPEHSIYIQPLL